MAASISARPPPPSGGVRNFIEAADENIYGATVSSITPRAADRGTANDSNSYQRYSQRSVGGEPWSAEKELREMSEATAELKQQVYAAKIQAMARGNAVRDRDRDREEREQAQDQAAKERATRAAAAREAARAAVSAMAYAIRCARRAAECVTLVGELRGKLLREREVQGVRSELLQRMQPPGGMMLVKHGRRGKPKARVLSIMQSQMQIQQAYGGGGAVAAGMRLQWKESAAMMA